MSKSEADHQDNAPDIITDRSSFPGESGVPAISGDAGEVKTSSIDKFPSNRPFIPKTERYNKTHVYKPMRTSSAPPEEHGGGDIHKTHFQPTKTQQSFQSEQGRRPPFTNYSGGRGIPGRNFTTHREEVSGSPHHSGTGTETSSLNEASHVAQIGNDTPRSFPSSPVVVGSEAGLSVITASASTDTAGGGGGGSRPTHSPTATSSNYDRNSPHTSPLVHPSGGPAHHKRGSSSGNMGMSSGNSSPHTVGGTGGYNRDSPYNKTGDYRDSRDGNRDRMTAGRTNRRAQQQQSYTRGNNSSGIGGQDQMGHRSGGGNYINQAHVPIQQQGWQQQAGASFTDAYGNPTMPQQGQQLAGIQQYGFQPVQVSVSQGMNPQAAARQPHAPVMTHQQVPPQSQQQQQVMYGHMPQQQQQQAPQQMMSMYQPQQQYIYQQHPGQMYIQTPQGLMQQGLAYPGTQQQYSGMDYNTEAMIAHTIAEMQQRGMQPGTFFQIVLHPSAPPITVQIPPLPTQQYAQYQQALPNHPQQVQMQQQMHGQQIQVPMYAAPVGSEMAGYMQQQHQQPGHMMHPMATAAGGSVQPHMQPAVVSQTPYGSYNQGVVPQGQHFNQQAGYQGGPGTGSHGGGQTSGPTRGQGYATGSPRAQHSTQHSMSHESPQTRTYPPRAGPHQPADHTTPSPAGQAQPVAQASTSTAAGSTNAPADTSTATSSSTAFGEVSQVSENSEKTAPTATAAASEPVKEQVPVVRERKVLSYKKKDGSALDIMSFKEKQSKDSTAATQSSSAGVDTDHTTPTADTATDVVGNGNVSETGVPTTTNVPIVADNVESAVTIAVPVEVEVATAIPVTAATTATTTETTDVKTTEPTAPKPSVHEQLSELRISPSEVTAAPNTDTPISPPIKFGDLPVSLSAQPITGYSSVSTTAPSIDVPSAPVSLPAVSETVASVTTTPAFRGKKASKKELLAKADAQAATSSELSAYIDSSSITSVPAAAVSIPTAAVVVPSVTSTPVLTSIKSTPPTPALSTVTDALPDSWDDAAELNLPPAIVSASEGNSGKETTGSRSLRPGGKAGFNINLHQTAAVMRYTKQEIYSFRPVDKPPNPLGSYTVITTTEPSSNHNTTPSGQKSGWSKRGSGQGGAEGGGGGHEGWKRDSNLPTPPPNSTGKHRKSSSTSVPMPKKIITDPILQLSYDTMAILNKLTPQTFEKLSQKMLSLKVENITEMNKVIELIFEKAVQEQSFANLYAELCAYLNAKATHWSFFTVVRIEPSNGECFWIREFTFPMNYAGPYYSLLECYNAVSGKEKPILASVSVALEVVECVLLHHQNILIQILRNDKSSAYYIAYTPFDAVDPEKRGQHTFSDARSAQKDAKNKYNFRAKLVTNCQTEFQNTTMNESEYRNLEEELIQLNTQKHSLSEADYFYRSNEIEEKRMKLKRRMLGNIRFVGELFKQKLLTDITIQTCITDLMGSSTTSWKVMHDEQVIECLCHLLTTAGERLQAKVKNTPSEKEFNLYFERLRYLSKDKTLNSRMRFAIEEVIALRDNDWHKRRETDGPVKLDVIQRRVQEQHLAAAAASSSGQYTSGNRPGASGFPPRGTPHAQPKQLLTRPRGGGAGGAQDSRKSGGGGGPAAGDRVFRSSSAVGHEPQHGKEGGGRPQGGEALRRAQSEYTPSSGTGTPTSVGSGPSYPIATDSQHLRRSSEPSITADLSNAFNDQTLMNRSKSVVSEFLEQKDINEVKLFLSEGPPGTCGYLILQVIHKCMHEIKGPAQKDLLNMLSADGLSEELRQSKADVLDALRFCEELKCLVDTTVDIKEAPEKFGSILAVLVRVGVLSQEDMQSITEEAKQNCLVEMLSDEQDCVVIFGRFWKQFNADIMPIS